MMGRQQPREEEPGWERKLLRDLAQASLKEQRAARRWGIFFKLLFFLYLLFALMAWIAISHKKLALAGGKPFTAVVELNGVIKADSAASADKVVSGLRDAFKNPGTKGVVLRINSPGGSPVQARTIHDEILRLRKKHPKIPLYAVITDICASGGYYVAVAADKIYADPASIVGSIGVLINGFGFVEAMKKLGIERRLLTAGVNKGILDPFSPLPEGQRRHLQRTLERLHRQFIATVRQGRAGRLKEDDTLFSGLFDLFTLC